jgi:tRNA pseudouridine65 synthase
MYGLNSLADGTACQQQAPLTILYEDDNLVAVDKPAGLLVHRSNIDKHETQFLLQRLRDQIGVHLFPIHRLDKSTSGVIIFAKSPSIAAQLQEQIAGEKDNPSAVKEYLLVCRGYTPLTGIIDHPLKPINDFKHRGAAIAASKPAQSAVTEFTRLHTIELPVAIDKYPASRYSLVKANLITGRKHQIRRHFKHISHPIIGCPKYGKSMHNRYFAETLGAPRLLLHAYRLQFQHPLNGQITEIVAPLTGCFADLIRHFEWTDGVCLGG